MVAIGAEVRRWLRCPCNRCMLFRRGERLVDLKALEETDSEHYYNSRMASELGALGCRLHRLSCQSLL